MQNRLMGLPLSLIIAIIIVLGALFSREFPNVGRWIIVVALALYVLRYVKYTVWVVRSIRQRNLKQIAYAAIVVGLLASAISVAMSGSTPYFLILISLGVDYLLRSKTE